MNYFNDDLNSLEEALKRKKEEDLENSKEELKYLLDSEYSSNEKIFQNFFERNPYFLPGASIPRGIIDSDLNYAPFPGAVISQPPLNSYLKYIPDFLWIAYDKFSVYPVFIEIEAPSKKWFKKNGKHSADFTQALNQLIDWKTWFDDENNKQVFWKTLKVPYFLSETRKVEPKFILIYGREKEFSSVEKQSKRKFMERDGFQLLTYDELRPLYEKMYLTTTKLTSREYVFYDNWRGHPVQFLLSDIQLVGGDSDFFKLMSPIIEKYKGENIRSLPEVDWQKMTYAEYVRGTTVTRHNPHNYLKRIY